MRFEIPTPQTLMSINAQQLIDEGHTEINLRDFSGQTITRVREGTHFDRCLFRGAVIDAELKDVTFSRCDLTDAKIVGDVTTVDVRTSETKGLRLAALDAVTVDTAFDLERGLGLVPTDRVEMCDWHGYDFPGDHDPDDMRAELYEIIKDRVVKTDRLSGDTEHACNTAHCAAGWINVLHPQGLELEAKFGPDLAASKVLAAYGIAKPDFYGENEEAAAWFYQFQRERA